MKKIPKVFLSIEKLHHFNCGECKRWWSIGDAEKMKKEWFCPWCGVLQKAFLNGESKKIKRKF
jgi:uncharacterized Zn-finger protein